MYNKIIATVKLREMAISFIFFYFVKCFFLIITVNVKNKVSKGSSNSHKNNRYNNNTTTTIDHTNFSNIKHHC